MTFNPFHAHSRIVFSPEGLGDGGAPSLTGGTEYTEALPSTTANATVSGVTVLSDGGHVLMWSDQDGNASVNKWQRFDAAGNAVTPINTINGSGGSVSALADGGFAITYNTWQNIQVQRFDAASAAVGDPIIADSSPYNGVPTVTGLPDGGFLMTWTGYPVSGEWEDGVLMRRYDADGIPVGAAQQVNTEAYGNQGALSVTVLADGGFVIAWRTQTQDANWSYGVAMRRYDATGVPVGPEVAVSPTTAHEFDPDITALADGGWVVTWSSDKDDIQDIYGQIYNADGSARGGEIHIANPGYQFGAEVAALADGGFMVAWSSNDPNTYDGSIVGQRYDATGTAIGESFTLNQTQAGNQSAPLLAARPDGGFVIAWQTDGVTSYDPMNPWGSYQPIGGTVSLRVYEPEGAAQVQSLISAMASFAPAPLGQGDWTEIPPDQIQPVIAASLT